MAAVDAAAANTAPAASPARTGSGGVARSGSGGAPAPAPSSFLTCVEVRDTGTRGRGVFVTLPAGKGADAFCEPPYACVQTLASAERAPACAHCLCPLGPLTAHAAAAMHAGDARRARAAALSAALFASGAASGGGGATGTLPALSGHAQPQPCAVPCPSACGDVFCGAACRDAACAGWHGLLCDGACEGDAHPLREFRRHAAATSEIFLLGARTLATALAAALAAGGTRDAVNAATAPLRVRGRGKGACAPPAAAAAACARARAFPAPHSPNARACARPADARAAPRRRRAGAVRAGALVGGVRIRIGAHGGGGYARQRQRRAVVRAAAGAAGCGAHACGQAPAPRAA
jgi:hypothetical protein